MMSTSTSLSTPGRVMVIALDGATWDLIDPWMEQGHLPNIARVVSLGVSANMLAEMPPSSVPNWPAFMTGKNAGKHGCLWWLQRDASKRLDSVPVDSRSVLGETIWSHLSAQGRKVIVQNVPVTYPIEPVNGVIISGLLTPRSAQDFVFPASLKPELDAVVNGYQIYPLEGYAKGREQKYLDGQVANIRQHVEAADFLLNTRTWDFFILVIGPTDEAAHKVWHYQDPQHPLYRSEEAAKFRNILQKIYIAADEAIGVLTRNLTEKDTLIVMSDHGFGPVESFFHTNNWLMQQGFLRLKTSGSTLLKKGLFSAGLTPRNIYPIGKQILSFFRSSNVLRQRLDPGRQGRKSPLRRVFLSNEDIDWSRTSVLATGFLYSQLFINLRGREPEGIVNPSEYESLREELIGRLSTLTNPATGKHHYCRIYRREEIYSGPYLEGMPDLLCVPRDLRTADSGMGFRSGKLFDTDYAISGTHREVGIFAMCGPGIQQGVRIPPIRIFDLAPTIIYCLDIPIPDDMDGQVITNAFTGHQLVERQVKFTAARQTRTKVERDLGVEDEESVKKRLRDLGYLS